jgi:hypothetical protein
MSRKEDEDLEAALVAGSLVTGQAG